MLPRSISNDEQAAEVLALAYDISKLAEELCAYDHVENRAHRALSMNGQSAASIIAALIAGDEDEKRMLASLKARACAISRDARSLAGRLAGVDVESVDSAPLFAELMS